MLLVLAAAFALLLGGYRVYSDIKSLPDETAIEKAQELDRLEQQQYESKREMLSEEIRQLEQKSEQANNYNENSLLMRIDPYNKEVAKLTFSVNADIAALAQDIPESWQIPTSVDLKADRENRIVSQYLILANGVSLSDLMVGTEYSKVGAQYLKELVCISEQAQGMVTIEAYTTEHLSGERLARGIYEYCLSKQASIAAIAGAHSLELVDAGSMVEIDLLLVDEQLLAQTRPADIAAQLADKTKELEELVEPAALTLATPSAAIKGGVKYAILGAIVGLCIGAVIAFLVETMGTNFKGGMALSQALSSRYLGNLHAYKQKKGLDAWADKLTDADIFKAVAAEDRLPLLAVNIKVAAEDKRVLLITGLRAQGELESLINDLAPYLGNEYRLVAATNLLINAQAIQKLKDIEGVVIVEGAKTANVERVIKVKQYLDEVKATLIGVVWA
ncbi:MAG: hypothetical protein ABFC62_10475 [Clostridiaceae bacterium]